MHINSPNTLIATVVELPCWSCESTREQVRTIEQCPTSEIYIYICIYVYIYTNAWLHHAGTIVTGNCKQDTTTK